MKKNKKWIRLLLILFFALLIVNLTIYNQLKLNVHDSFEASRLQKIWSTSRMERDSYEFQSKVVRKGKYALKITLKYGDKVEFSNTKDKDTERDELLESRSLYALENNKYDYQFSLFLPDSFPILPVRLVLAQWKQDCPLCPCHNYSPIVALRYVSGRLFVTLQTDSVQHKLFALNEEIRGRWLDFRFIIKFSKDNNGEIVAFLNENEIVNYKGVTSYLDDCKILSKKNKYYFKMGLYRDRMSDPMTIYIDEYSKKRIN